MYHIIMNLSNCIDGHLRGRAEAESEWNLLGTEETHDYDTAI